MLGAYFMNVTPETAEERLARMEAAIDTLSSNLERRFSSIAQELRRAEDRDERTVASLKDIYGHLRQQDMILQDLKKGLTKQS